MMNQIRIKNTTIIFIVLLAIVGCQTSVEEEVTEVEKVLEDSVPIIAELTEELPLLAEDTSTMFEEEETISSDWKNLSGKYEHFKNVPLDTILIGPTREVTDPFEFFRKERSNLYVLIEAGEYVNSFQFWIDCENVIIRGEDGVSIFCDELYENVMWVQGKNIVIDNLHMCHLIKGEYEGQNCTGRVLAFDNADSVTVMNCDLNGCGLAGLHDNVGNGVIFVEHNYIHNNSIGAYTDIDGGVWQEEIDNHAVFKFKDNLILNNGFDHVPEEMYGEEEYDGH